MFNIRSSLRIRILVLTGSVISLLMLLISFVLLFQWRSIIIQKETENASSISKTFAVTVVDAMIYEEKSLYKKESILETYVENFILRLGNVTYVSIIDKNDAAIIQQTNHPNNVPLQPITIPNKNRQTETKIYDHRDFGWTLEIQQPILLSQKYWGLVIIGFDAEPIRSEIRLVFFFLLSSTIFVTAIVLAILYVLINRITNSMEKLVHAIDSIDFSNEQQLDFSAQQDEIGFFYHNFKLLQERLDNSKKELERAQQQIYQAEKLASIGRLASGVAHQVNNPLNGIKSCLYALKQNPADKKKTEEYLELINEGIDNIEMVVKKLLGFARQQSSASEQTIHSNDAIRKVVQLFELRLKEKMIHVSLNLAESIALVKIDYHLFQEVIMNLILNSYDAITANGQITISTLQTNASSILITIRDNGEGIAADDLKKIFDPFFTTKDVGTGTGLGLSVCLGIIEAHGGTITVQSAPNVETVFTITLPAYYEN